MDVVSVDISYLDPELRAAYLGPHRVVPAVPVELRTNGKTIERQRIEAWMEARAGKGLGPVTGRRVANFFGIGINTSRDILRNMHTGGLLGRSMPTTNGKKQEHEYWWKGDA